MTSPPEGRISLGEAAYRRVRADIVTCRLPPGQRLTEKQLSADTGFGVSPLRDALTRLDHDGLIRTLPRKGYQVAPLTPKSVEDLLDMWEIVGPELVRRGVTRASQEQLDRAQALFEMLDRLGQGTSGPATGLRQVELARDVFSLFAAATGNGHLISLYERISSEMSRVWALIYASDPETAAFGDAAVWARQIIPGRDADLGAETARRYIAEVRERMLRVIMRWPSVMRSDVVPIDRFPPPGHLGD